jgi:hypothetical protein
MKNIIYTILVIVLLLSSQNSYAEESQNINWPKGKSSVAWKTKKRMYWVANVEPVGVNSEIEISAQNIENAKIITLSIPIAKFDSDSATRDKEVLKILKGDIQPNLIFTSVPITALDEDKIRKNQFSGDVAGELKIGGKSFPVIFSVKTSEDGIGILLNGELHTSFSKLEIEPPSIAGGFVAKVREDLSLLFHLYVRDILHKTGP